MFYHARYYAPTIGRFIQADTIIPQPKNPQDFNRYAYVRNNPLVYVDPLGHSPIGPSGKLIIEYMSGLFHKLINKTMPSIVSRSEWGALEPGAPNCNAAGLFCMPTAWGEGFYDPDNNPGGYAYYSDLYPDRSLADELDTVVIHHEGNNQQYDVQSVQIKHMTYNGWTDIGYHFIIDPSGTIYEGRDIRVRGAHVKEKNSHKVGVLLLGDFQPGGTSSFLGITLWRDNNDDMGPTSEQVQSTLDLVGWLDFMYGIEQVVGHRYYNDTECPGDYCMPYIPIFNAAVQERDSNRRNAR